MREADLLIRRDRFMSRGSGPFWHRLGVAPPDAQALRVSLFAYETEGLGGLLEAWRDGDRTVWCAIPESRVSPQVREWANDSLPAGGAPLHRGALTLQTLPFISQDDYDLLLWTCDLNFVRGEDSFVRAQWAAQPFVWQIYRQDEDTHIAKLDAFLCRYLKNAPKNTADALRAFHAEWNPAAGNSSARPGGAWPSLATTLPVLQRHAAQWCDHLAHEIDLAAALAEFAKGKLK